MFIEALLLGILIGVVRNGRLTNLIDMQIRGAFLVLLSFVLQLSPMVLARMGVTESWLVLLPFAAMLLIAGALLLNLNKPGVWLLLLGLGANIVAMSINGFHMPVNMDTLQVAGLTGLRETILDGSVINYIPASNAVPWTVWLGKFIPVPRPYPVPQILSPGDVLISIGIIALIQGEMNRALFRPRGRMVSYSYKNRL